MSLVHHQRLAAPSHVSIERLFDEVRSHLPDRWHARLAVCPHLSNGLLSRLDNMRAARRAASRVNHIVGDVHYLALSLPREGLVLTIHDCATLRRLQGVAREVFRQLWFVQPMLRAQVVTTISQTIRSELESWVGPLARQVRVIPNCVRSEFVPWPKPFPAGKDDPTGPVILQVGTGWNKNLGGVCAALDGLRCRLDIVGEIDERQRVLLAQSGVPHRELGRISDSQVLEAYRQCDLVVFTSLYEGFGLPILEAQATGRPIITSNFGAMAEAAGAGALLVDPHQPSAIREAVVALCTRPDLRAGLVDRGFENLKRYQPSAIAAAYADVYGEVYGEVKK